MICPICEDASDSCDCFENEEDPRGNPLIDDDSWINDPDMGSK